MKTTFRGKDLILPKPIVPKVGQVWCTLITNDYFIIEEIPNNGKVLIVYEHGLKEYCNYVMFTSPRIRYIGYIKK